MPSSTNEKILVGERLLKVREQYRMTQSEFSKELGISLRGYQNYERGEREISNALICALFNLYKIEPIWLITGEGDMYHSPHSTDCPEWLREWWEKAGEKERGWLEVELKRLRSWKF